ncbi:ATP-dependent DNA ligase [Liquorilactobacillus mali]|uniref:DNA ligase, ATP-dependent n=1 Tax=Liquorilactobacillus mali KCTC 3596 = DSM 20444 TaxID=1046596 RepID=A0A0R2EE79_9LACO|nr:RNA ligase family protein [Liquorilactobacillus mali]KRN10860.1 DNA ligase, ATP-dependent [Liquorilactobacillus mali KCTC 3596 = DSM 20444]
MQNIIEIATIFQRISETSSKNEKVSIIKENEDNILFKEVLKFVFDDFIRTGISTKKMSVTDLVEPDQDFNNILELMEYVEENNTGKLQVVSNIKNFAKKYSESVEQFILNIFAKNIKVGITAKSINKALCKGFIKEFSCQLAYPMNKYPDRVESGRDFSITQKLDGHRCVAICDGVEVAFFTRQGIRYVGLDLLGKQVEVLANIINQGKPVVLDGELVLDNKDNLETKDLFRATAKVLKNDKADKTGILFNVFDWLPLDEFFEGESKLAYLDRKSKLAESYVTFTSSYDMVATDFKLKIVPTLYSGNDTSIIAKLQDEKVKKLGWEGLMLNFNDSFYKTKRTPDLLKIKQFFNADVLVKDVYEGTGANKNKLGGVIIQFKDFEVQVGSGFTEDDRVKYWNNPEDIIGKIIDVQYFEESENQNGGKSLRFPTFKSVRSDKNIDDISYES